MYVFLYVVLLLSHSAFPTHSRPWCMLHDSERERERDRERDRDRDRQRHRERVGNTEILFNKAMTPFEGV